MGEIDNIVRDRKTRVWLYSVATAALVLLGFYGVISKEAIALWGFLAATITGLASVNVPNEDSDVIPRRSAD